MANSKKTVIKRAARARRRLTDKQRLLRLEQRTGRMEKNIERLEKRAGILDSACRNTIDISCGQQNALVAYLAEMVDALIDEDVLSEKKVCRWDAKYINTIEKLNKKLGDGR